MGAIAGFWQSTGDESEALIRGLAPMEDALLNRAPSSGGRWVCAVRGVGMATCRGTGVEERSSGAPLVSLSGRYVIVMDGRVYNTLWIRKELQAAGVPIAGESELASVLAAIEAWGVHKATIRFDGSFTFALWDQQERRLSLARDRMGIKPLYYSWTGDTILWASSISALKRHAKFRKGLNGNAATFYFRHGFVPAPHTLLKDVWKLPSGSVFSVTGSPAEYAKVSPSEFWSPIEAGKQGVRNSYTGDRREALDEAGKLLRLAVHARSQNGGGTPYGALLTGEVDSVLVAAMMKAELSRPLKTFSLRAAGGAGWGVEKVGKCLGTEHYELEVSEEMGVQVAAELLEACEEPVVDPAQIAMQLLCQFARKEVPGVLVGTGGSELFGGHLRYHRALSAWKRVRWIPASLRRASTHESGEVLYQAEVTQVSPLVEEWVRHCPEPSTALSRLNAKDGVYELGVYMMLYDLVSLLPEVTLTGMDRAASRAGGLDVAMPLLDRRVVDFAMRLPGSLKLGRGGVNWMLKALGGASFHLEPMPCIPVGAWLRGPLRELGERGMSVERLRQHGFLRVDETRQAWECHLAGRGNHGEELWKIVMMQAWLERNIG